MIVVFAGAQAAAENGSDGNDPRRLTTDQLEEVRGRIRRLFARVRPSMVIGAAASGADLVVLEAAAAEAVPRRVVLPFDVAAFRETSVEPKGGVWTAAYDRLLQELAITDPPSIEEGHSDPNDSDVYTQHNSVLLDRARALAGVGERVWVLVVQSGETTGTVTDDLVVRAEGQGLLVLDVDATRLRPERRTAFIAMPYGKKFDPVSRRKIDCDQLFDRVYVPVFEDLDVEWLRADLDTDTGIIHVGMIEALANTDLVIADLSTLNANVAYEIGLRHALAPHSTVLVSPYLAEHNRRLPVPFDVSPIRTVSIERSLLVTDEQAEAAIRALKRVLADAIAASRADSPVSAWFEHQPSRPLVRRAEIADAMEREAELRNRVAQAARSSVAEVMRDATAEVADANVPEPVRLSLRLELAQALHDEGWYDEASKILSISEPATDDPRRLTWLHQQVMVLRRLGERARKAGDTADQQWETAERLINEAMAFGDREETLGIVAGLVKRRLMGALEEGDDIGALALFARLMELYERAFNAEPSYYGGVNFLATLRLAGQRFGQEEQALTRARELVFVIKFFAEREHAVDPDDLWPIATLGEVALHEALLRDAQAPDITSAGTWYGQLSSRPRSSDARQSATDQLRFFVLTGDPQPPLEGLMRLLTAG